MISRNRGSLGPSAGEIRTNPQDVRLLKEAEPRAATPEILTDVSLVKELKLLETGPSAICGTGDEPVVMISEEKYRGGEHNSDDTQDDGRGKLRRDLREWVGYCDRNVDSIKNQNMSNCCLLIVTM